MENTKNRKKRLKTIIIIISSCFACLGLLLGIGYFIMQCLKSDRIATRVVDESIRFSDVNYEADIFSDPLYYHAERNITFIQYGDSVLIGDGYAGEDAIYGIAPESVYKSFGEEAVFFRNYFLCLIEGRYEDYEDFFTTNFFEYYSIPEKFTCQKIYDISVEVYDRETTEYNGSEAVIASYIVRYKIMNNNGTFRGDVESDTVKPLYFRLLEQNGIILIDSVTFISEKKVQNQ